MIEAKRPVLAIDFDDVLVETMEPLCFFHNKMYGTRFSAASSWSFDLEEVWGCSVEEVHRRLDEFHTSSLHDESLPAKGAHEALTKFATLFELHMVTSRPDRYRERTAPLLERHFPDLFSEFHFGKEFGTKGRHFSKANVCQDIQAVMLIDDGLHNAEEVAGVGIPTLLFDRPWNQTGILPSLVTRVHSWQGQKGVYGRVMDLYRTILRD
ncbi:MAG TPA: hypothetical protein VMU27_01585 [Candidatus Paceibacterota bacterium]|nr:hypothetical protein [Candidatus Paceibacterota bacterium]